MCKDYDIKVQTLRDYIKKHHIPIRTAMDQMFEINSDDDINEDIDNNDEELADKIKSLLFENRKGLKAKEIAKLLNEDKKKINSILYKNKDEYFIICNSNSCMRVKEIKKKNERSIVKGEYVWMRKKEIKKTVN